MTDNEIRHYLEKNNFEADAQDCLMKVFNTSHQILEINYDFDSGMMTIITPDNEFTFKWNV